MSHPARMRTTDMGANVELTGAAWGGWSACAEEAERIYSRECTELRIACMEYMEKYADLEFLYKNRQE